MYSSRGVIILYDRTQMNKGLLEGCILKILSTQNTYGYNIILFLTEAGFSTIKESTIYPLLVRLEKKDIFLPTMNLLQSVLPENTIV